MGGQEQLQLRETDSLCREDAETACDGNGRCRGRGRDFITGESYCGLGDTQRE
jgi:hypothetical protein